MTLNTLIGSLLRTFFNFGLYFQTFPMPLIEMNGLTNKFDSNLVKTWPESERIGQKGQKLYAKGMALICIRVLK